MGNLITDLGKALLNKKNAGENDPQAAPSTFVQSRCLECRYNSEAYDVDEYCADCDGQSHFTPREDAQDFEEPAAAYDQILELLPQLSDAQKKQLIARLEDSLERQEVSSQEPADPS
ncbi:MAG: hypothetical protein K9J81_06570 [Desulfohalobiaceae bacterium]|nr:hypothetical protein [Desulfohalobiaceae bacterium]